MSKKLLFKGGHATGMIPYEIEDFSTLYMMDARVDEKTKAYIDSVIGNSVLNVCPYRNVLVTHKYDTVEGNVVTLDDCEDDEIIQLSEIQGNTMVNCNKDTDKELILMPNLDTNGYSNITLTQGIDGGKVDISLEGNTMVNVCDQEDPVAITKSYTVETGNHIALQDEYDGKCRPNVYGNTLVNLAGNSNLWDVGCSGDVNTDYTITSTNNQGIVVDKLTNNVSYLYFRKRIDPNLFKPSTTYTIIFNSLKANNVGVVSGNTAEIILPLTSCNDGYNVVKITSTDLSTITGKNAIYVYLAIDKQCIDTVKVSDVIVLEGDYTNKPIPDYFTGMKSSFEDKLITDEKDAHNGKYKVDYKVTGKNKFNINNEFTTPSTAGKEYITVNGNTTTITPTSGVNIRKYFKIKVNPNTTYNMNGTVSYGMVVIYKHNINTDTFIWDTSYIHTFKNYTKQENVTLAVQFTTGADEHEIYVRFSNESISVPSIFTNIQIEEGTTATTYEPYKESIKTLYLNSPLLEGDTIEQSGNDIVHMHRYKTVTFDGSDDEKWVYWGNNTDNGKLDSSLISFYLSFTNYKDFTTSTIFNNKFLMANTVWGATTEIMALNADNIMSFQVALLRSKLATQDLAGFKTWLQQNPITVVYELATPTQEVISTNDSLLLDSYVNGHLDVDSVVPIDKVVFQSYGTSLKYLSPNTEYTIQFESDNTGILNALALNVYDTIGNLNIVKGINKFNITTKAEITTNYLWTNGIGFNMSKVVVTPKVEQPFGYFKGMKSVGECEDLEIVSNNNDNTLSNKQTMTHEPLRGLPNGVCDKYVIIDGKWYIERNCGYSNVIIDKKSVGNNGLSYRYSYIHNGNSASISSSIASKTMFVDNMYGAKNVAVADYSSTKDKNTLYFHFANMDNVPSYAQDLASFREFIDGKVINIVFLLNTPTYEPIDYNPFEVYTDTTHISNNSNIPCNMVIRNSGFNCMLKPNTTYTVSSNNGLSSVTTKASIGDGILRFYDKDTTSVTKMSNVLVLEGDYITGNPPIPAFFKGMESAFEQKLVTDEKDEHYGKYKVNVKAVGKNLLDESKGVINSSLGNSKTICIKVKPNTTYVYSSSVYKGAIAIYQLPFMINNSTNIQELDSMGYNSSTISDSQSFTTSSSTNYIFMNYDRASNVQIEQGTNATEYEPHKQNNITFYINEPLRGIGDIKDKVYVKEDKVVVERNCGHKVLDGTETSWQAPSNDNYKYGVFTLYMPHLNHKEVKMDDKNEQGALCNTLRPYWWWTSKDSFETVPDNSIHYLAWDNYDTFYIIKKNLRTVDEFKQWLKANKTEYIYPLAEPVYEEVECDLSKLALEGYDHGTLFYDTNIPVTTQFYEFNINIKDMLIPNETYYVTFNADRVKDITINLSGVQVNYKTSMGYNKVPIQLGDVVNTNFSMDSRGVELSDLMVSTSTSLIYVKDMNDVCVYDEATNKYSITITSTDGNESDKRVILLDYPLLRLNKDIYDRLYYSNKDNRYRIDKKVFKYKFTNEHEYSKYAAETNDTYYSSFISLNETIKDYVVITNEKVKTVKVEDDKYYFKIKWSDLGVSDKTEANGNQGVKDFFNNNEVYLYYATDGFVEIVDGLRRQTLKVYQPETFMKFSGNTTTTVTILIPMKNV